MKRFFYNNGLSIVLFTIFFVTLVGMSFAGWLTATQDANEHSSPSQSYGEYIVSGDFAEGVFENWESEFLQMWALVVLTIYFRQKGSDESKPLRGKLPQEAKSRYSFWNASDMPGRLRALRHVVYSHSLSIALLSIFIVSFLFHAAGGTAAYNENAQWHNQETVSVLNYMGTSQFWYESLQNWQSEFFAVGMLIVLTIHLRQRGSPESKPVGISYDQTTGS